MMAIDDKIARAGYLVFSASFSQEQATAWKDIPPSIRDTWRQVARAIVEEFARETTK